MRAILKLDQAINENAISTALKILGQSGACKLQMLLLSRNARWLRESGLQSDTWIEKVKGPTMAGSTLTDNFWANDILWQLSVFAYNISVMMRQKKNTFKKQEHRSFIDWFIAVPARITRSGHQTEIKMYENHFYKADWEELDWLIEAA